MIIDAHNHADWHGHGLKRYLENMDRYGIDVTWLLSWECPVDEYDPIYGAASLPGASGPLPIERSLTYVAAAPGRFVLGYAPDPRLPGAIDRLQAAMNIYDVRVYGELKLRMMYDNPDALRVYRFCGENGLPVTVHIDYEFDRGTPYPRPNYWYGGGIEAFERAVAACPETVFIGHAPGFWAHISGDDLYDKEPYPKAPIVPGGKLVDMFRTYANLYADLSAGSALNALQRDEQFAVAFIDEFQDRLLFGRDYFDDRMQAFLNGLGLAQSTLDSIFYGNATRLVSMP